MPYCKLLPLVFLLSLTKLNAQHTPWQQAPQTKTVESWTGKKITLKLKLDTLFHTTPQRGSSFFLSESTWYNGEVDKVGFGYVDEQGQPAGLWKYYIKKDNTYTLFCEGSYARLTPNNLFVEEDIQKSFPSSADHDARASYIEGLKEKFFFSGEWRFYQEDRLARIIVVNDKVQMPYLRVMNGENLQQASLSAAIPTKQRLSGNIIAATTFYPNGKVKHIWAEGINMEFTMEGKPQVPQMEEIILVDQ